MNLSSSIGKSTEHRCTAVLRSLQRCQIGLWLKDIQRVVSKSLFCYFGCVFQRGPERGLAGHHQDVSLHCCLLLAMTSLPFTAALPHDTTTTVLFCMDGVGPVMTDVWIFDVWIFLAFRPTSSIVVSSHQGVLFFLDFSCLYKLQMGCLCVLLTSRLCLATLLYRIDRWSAAEMVGLLKESLLFVQ